MHSKMHFSTISVYITSSSATESSRVLGYWGMQTSLREGYYLFLSVLLDYFAYPNTLKRTINVER
jgi:hypothetical protein